MRYVYLALIALTVVTVNFLGADFSMSMSFLILGAYLLGMLTGSSVYGLLRTWIKGALQKAQ